MKISRSAFYKTNNIAEQRFKDDMVLRDKIEEIHVKFPGYGYRRIRIHLLREGICINSKRIRRVMKRFALFSCLKKWLRPRGAALGVRLSYPNLIGGMKLRTPNRVWATDITYIKLLKEYVCLSAIIDVYASCSCICRSE